MAGRRPKPTHLKVVEGNPGKRALNKKEPKPRREVPSPPAHLSDTGRMAWGRLTVLLDRMGVLTEADSYALERLCSCYCELLKFQFQLEREGETYAVHNQLGEVLIKAHPAQAMLADADRRFKGYLIEFGLTPAARSKVEVKKDDDDTKDPLAEFFG
ncbi:phage terminase small subunit P27 family [Paraburkholderia xenovorans]|uniref:phage terminase small subunit P27 family n=1 Tax=Paraburkholderia xenovorans TaxID=36873 RepID=UPI0015599AC3|nr:phage terminase small subunit P27 family [Paraburkholderia xenovorans]NPT36242.1 phage terminase small subunit P27 family [Paraburkholderia xenovorans]